MNEAKGQPACPDWAETMIKQIKLLEIRLGNISETVEWATSGIQKLSEQSFGDGEDETVDGNMVEQLFIKIVRGLAKEGFSVKDITSMINGIIITQGSLPYCNEDEVKETLD